MKIKHDEEWLRKACAAPDLDGMKSLAIRYLEHMAPQMRREGANMLLDLMETPSSNESWTISPDLGKPKSWQLTTIRWTEGDEAVEEEMVIENGDSRESLFDFVDALERGAKI